MDLLKTRTAAFLAVLIAGVLAVPAGAPAQTFLTRDEALELAFPPPAAVERRTAYLTEEQQARARAFAGNEVSVDTRMVVHYRATVDGRPAGTAYFDAHRVRTLPEVLMVVVGPDDRVRQVEVLKFSEPPDYIAPEGWLAQFDGRPLDDDLSMKGDIVNMTGATLTSRAVTEAVRRILALHRVIEP